MKPTLTRWLGQPGDEPTVQATITRKIVSPEGDEEFLRVTVGQVGERVVASPLASGSGVLMSLVRVDGIVRIPRGEQGFEPGAAVTVSLFRPPESLTRTVVAIGSHDLTLDLLADELGGDTRGAGSLRPTWAAWAASSRWREGRRISPVRTCLMKRPVSTTSPISAACCQKHRSCSSALCSGSKG